MTVLHDLERCFEGAIPAVLATASADGVPNVTYISKAHRIGDDRLALSNQFMSKTARNLAVNPRASLLLMDPVTHDEFRLSVVYERTERRGHLFERLREDVDAVAELSGMRDVFRLRAATIFRVVDVIQVEPNPAGTPGEQTAADAAGQVLALGELAARLGRCCDLDVLVDAALDGLDQLLGYHHVHLLLLDEDGRRLYTIASRGFDAESIGAEVAVGEGPIGLAASRCQPVRIASLGQMTKYARSIVRQYEDTGGVRPGRELSMPGLSGADSRVAVPVMAVGQLVGVLAADSREVRAFGPLDERVLGVVATMLGGAIAHAGELDQGVDDGVSGPRVKAPASPVGETALTLRCFDVDGSVFLDGDYLIKGVAGRILRSLLRQYDADGRVEHTNRELRFDPSLQLPGFKDNLESRLILLKRRLDERGAPIRIERTGRGRFTLVVDRPLRLIES